MAVRKGGRAKGAGPVVEVVPVCVVAGKADRSGTRETAWEEGGAQQTGRGRVGEVVAAEAEGTVGQSRALGAARRTRVAGRSVEEESQITAETGN